jgi:hypothetical protein
MGHDRTFAAEMRLCNSSPRYDAIIYLIERAIVEDILEAAEKSRIKPERLWATMYGMATDNSGDSGEPWEFHILDMGDDWDKVINEYYENFKPT